MLRSEVPLGHRLPAEIADILARQIPQFIRFQLQDQVRAWCSICSLFPVLSYGSRLIHRHGLVPPWSPTAQDARVKGLRMELSVSTRCFIEDPFMMNPLTPSARTCRSVPGVVSPVKMITGCLRSTLRISFKT